MEDRSWAVGLSQPDFERAYMQRWPTADVIPLGSEWAQKQDLTYRTIDAPDPEKFLPDGPTKDVDRRAIPKQFPCRACGQVFGFNVARAGHERGCAKMKAKLAAEEVMK